MAVVMLEGWDKYGGEGSVGLRDRLMAGEWTFVNGAGYIYPGLSQTGYAMRGGSNINKQFYTGYPRLIGGFRFNMYTYIATTYSMANFLDEITHQCCITLTFGAVSGVLEFRNGTNSGTVIASGGVVLPYTTRYLEWDISFGNAAPYSIWLDGVLVMSGTADTTTTANNYASAFGLFYDFGGSGLIVDDLYLFDTTGPTNNAVLLNNPRIETTFPIADDSTQWTYGTATLGEVNPRTPSAGYLMNADKLYILPLIPEVDCTIESISIYPMQDSPAINLRPVLYAQGAPLTEFLLPGGDPGSAGALLATGPVVTGLVNNVRKTMMLSAPVALTAGVQVWLGFQIDSPDITLHQVEVDHPCYTGYAPFAAGAPATAPVLNQQGYYVIYGNLTNVSDSWYVVSRNPTQDDLGYLIDLTPGHQDMYHFGPLSLMAETVHTVVLKGYFIKTDVGIRTVSLHTKSGAVDSAGVGQAPHVERYTWLTTNYATDPNTGAQWLKPALNAALSGFKVET